MKRKKGGGGGANWMDTYGDMVTLLLCFFVLLYSMSSIEESKWAAIVQSFKRESTAQTAGTPGQGMGISDNTGAIQQDKPITQQEVKEALNQIAASLNSYSASNNLQQMMMVTQGADYVFITFQNAVFFEGDSYVLLDSGKVLLDEVVAAISPQSDLIDEIRVMGHTSQGDPTRPNNPTSDRFLASNRASIVTVYLQEKGIIDPDKLVSVGYGQWRPVDGFDTSVERSHNRRVELMITGLDPTKPGGSIDQYYTMREGKGFV